jgi:hypothetical protein
MRIVKFKGVKGGRWGERARDRERFSLAVIITRRAFFGHVGMGETTMRR